MAKLFERQELMSIISDLHKDVYGTRPHGIYTNHTLEELRAEADYLSEENGRQMAEQKLREAETAKAFEARVAETIATGAGDRATALRWIFEADGIMETVEMYGGSYASYELGLPYRYFEVEFPSYPKAA